MIAYIIRRLLYAIPILIGVNLITFALFFVVNPPDQMARLHLGPWGQRIRSSMQRERAGRQARHAAKLWRYVRKESI